jgi:hypothetical protein
MLKKEPQGIEILPWFLSVVPVASVICMPLAYETNTDLSPNQR